MTNTVSHLETDETTTRQTLGSLRHQLLETNENFVKDKDRLSAAHADISQRHQIASVIERKFLCFSSFLFFLRALQLISKVKFNT